MIESRESDDHSVQVLCVIKNSPDMSKRETYYDNDLIVDRSKVLERWNIKKCADPNVNFSKMNYKLRVLNDNSIPNKREFRSGIFLTDKKDIDTIELNDNEENKSLLNDNISNALSNDSR